MRALFFLTKPANKLRGFLNFLETAAFSRRFLLALLLLLLVSPLRAENFPDYTGYVNDYAGLLDAASRQKLESSCQALEQKTSAEMALAIVKTTAPLEPKEYAVKLFEKWKIGKKGKDNGLLILMAVEERRVEIEVGYGLEGVINDAKAGAILDRYVIPYFKQGKFADGLINGTAALAAAISGEPAESAGAKPAAAKEDDFSLYIIIALVVIMIVLSSLFSGWASGIGGAATGAIFGLMFLGYLGALLGAIIGFVLSFVNWKDKGNFGGWMGGMGGWGGGSWGGGGGGGWGGFGGGGSGGGGSGRSW